MNFNEYQGNIVQFAIYPESGEGTHKSLAYVMTGLTGEMGEVAEVIKKYMRGDEKYQDQEQRQDMLLGELGDVLWYLTRMCEENGLTLEDVAIANITKLTSRKNRNLIRGDGDDR